MQKQRDRDRETLRKTAELADLEKAKFNAEVEKNAAERMLQAKMQTALQLANEELNRKLTALQLQAMVQPPSPQASTRRSSSALQV